MNKKISKQLKGIAAQLPDCSRPVLVVFKGYPEDLLKHPKLQDEYNQKNLQEYLKKNGNKFCMVRSAEIQPLDHYKELKLAYKNDKVKGIKNYQRYILTAVKNLNAQNSPAEPTELTQEITT